MKKLMLVLSAGVVAAVVAGCASVQVAEPAQLNNQKLAPAGTTVAHINAQNWGLYFLKWPLFTGSVKATGSISAFDEDSVNVPSVANLVTAKANELGASQTLDMQSDRGGMMIPIPIPFLFYLNSVNVSGNAIR